MNTVLLHPLAKARLKRLASDPPHGILLVAPPGSGKRFVAQYLASKVLRINQTRVAQHPYIMAIDPEDGSISVEEIRMLKHFLQLRVPGASEIARVVLLIDAERMTPEAQNGVLKLLEEPPADTILIATTSQPSQLLPTVLSRVQSVQLPCPSSADCIKHFMAVSHTEAAVSKAFLISGGRIGLMTALLSKQSDHPLFKAIEDAKRLLAATKYERLCAVDNIAKQKHELANLLEGFACISQAALRRAGQNNNRPQTRRWYNTLRLTLKAQEALLKNASSKLVLTEFFLNI